MYLVLLNLHSSLFLAFEEHEQERFRAAMTYVSSLASALMEGGSGWLLFCSFSLESQILKKYSDNEQDKSEACRIKREQLRSSLYLFIPVCFFFFKQGVEKGRDATVFPQ